MDLTTGLQALTAIAIIASGAISYRASVASARKQIEELRRQFYQGERDRTKSVLQASYYETEQLIEKIDGYLLQIDDGEPKHYINKVRFWNFRHPNSFIPLVKESFKFDESIVDSAIELEAQIDDTIEAHAFLADQIYRGLGKSPETLRVELDEDFSDLKDIMDILRSRAQSLHVEVGRLRASYS